jgi:cell division cycle 14
MEKQKKPKDASPPGLGSPYAHYLPLSFGLPVHVLTITDRLYLAAYIHPPTADTIFPFPEPVSRSPAKRGRAAEGGTSRKTPFYFTIDDSLPYNAFHHDFGPLHIGHLYRFALYFHDILAAKENKDRPIVFWSRADPKSAFTLKFSEVLWLTRFCC